MDFRGFLCITNIDLQTVGRVQTKGRYTFTPSPSILAHKNENIHLQNVNLLKTGLAAKTNASIDYSEFGVQLLQRNEDPSEHSLCFVNIIKKVN